MARERNRGKTQSQNWNIDHMALAITSVVLVILGTCAILPPIFTITAVGALAVALSVGLPELFKSPEKQHSTMLLLAITVISTVLLLRDSSFFTIAICVVLCTLACFVAEILRFQGRSNLLYSLSINFFSSLIVVGAVSWIMFTRLYSWHFYVLPICFSIFVSNIILTYLNLLSRYNHKRHISLIWVLLVSPLVGFLISEAVIFITYRLGYQIYITSAVMFESSTATMLNYVIPVIYSALVAFVCLSYAIVTRMFEKMHLQPSSFASLIALSLIPVSLVSLPSYIIVRIIGG